MFNKAETTFSKLFLISLLLLALPLAACSTLTDSAAAAPTNQVEPIVPAGSTADSVIETAPTLPEPIIAEVVQETNDVDNSIDSVTTADLNEDEVIDLLFMREEEKLARDLYLAFYDLWGIPVFQNIAASEQAHMDAILVLINQYGLADPAAGKGAGVFDDPILQDLYDQLLALGSESAVDALHAGAAVEEIDILDLQGSLAQTHNDDIVAVYLNLLAGSENHLRAFVSSWERQTGETYLPQSLSLSEFDEIMDGTNGNGQGQGGQGGRGQGGNDGGQGGYGKGNRGGGQGRNGGTENGLGGPGGRGAQAGNG
jgi:hypothetical protein